MNYKEILNHKSILECDSVAAQEQHDKDCTTMFALFYDHAPAGAVVKCSYLDEYHKEHTADQYRLVERDNFESTIEAFDLKNGIDFVISENDEIGIAIHGQNYLMSGEHHSIECLLEFHFLNPETADLDKLNEQLEETYGMDNINQLLNDVYHDEKNILNTDSLSEKLHDVKRLPIDVQIRNAEEKQAMRSMKDPKQKSRQKEQSNEREF